MRKQLLSFVAIFLSIIICFCGCGKAVENKTDDSNESIELHVTDNEEVESKDEKNPLYWENTENAGKDTESDKKENDDVNSNPEQLILASNGKSEYSIVSFYKSSPTLTQFVNLIKTKTGVQLPISYTQTVMQGKFIVIASYEDVEHISGVPFKSWTGLSVIAQGELIFILSANEDLLGNSWIAFMDKLHSYEEGVFSVDKELKYTRDYCYIDQNVPKFVTEKGKFLGLYNCGSQNWQVTYSSITDADFNDYCNLLRYNGYTLSLSNTINDNKFCTYTKGKTQIHLNNFKQTGRFAIVYGPTGYLPKNVVVDQYKKVVTPTLSQMPLVDGGLSTVIQTVDGKFIVIDGGRPNAKDVTALWSFIKSKTPENEKPHISWFITHVHYDHIALAKSFLSKYKGEMVIEFIGYNFPDFMELKTPKETKYGSAYQPTVEAWEDLLEKTFPDVPICILHTGQRFQFAECYVDVLITPEDYYLNGFEWVNDTSLIFKIGMNGKTCMAFGDATGPVNMQVLNTFGSYIKADVMQLPHHGTAGGSLELYKKVDPSICLWPCSETTYNYKDTVGKANSTWNQWLKRNSGSNGERKRSHYHQGVLAVIDMSTLKTTTMTLNDYYNTYK